MKKLKIILLLICLSISFQWSQAQGLNKVPEKLHEFWHFEVESPGYWDGSLIGADFVEFFYQLFSIETVEELGPDRYRLKLRHENGNTIDLMISDLKDKQAKFLFSEWDQPRICQHLVNPTDTEILPFDQLPGLLYKEWTSDGNGTVYCKFHDKNQLFYQGKEWEIMWAGYYLKKEYRMLIRNGNLYKMLYLNNLSNQSLRLVCNLNAVVLSPMAPDKNIYRILGNYAEKSTNAWKLGFFENFAIVNGEFWNYKSIYPEGSNTNVLLVKDAKRAKVSICSKSEEQYEIAINDQQPSPYFKCKKNIPAYPTPDTISFKDTHFQKSDTVTIRGYLRNNPFNKPFSVAFTDPIKFDQCEFYGDVDSLGRFTIRFPLINTSQIYLDWGRMSKMDVAEPGETYFLFYDFSTEQHLIAGDNERIHNELVNYDLYGPLRSNSQEDYERREKMAPMEYLEAGKADLVSLNKSLCEFVAENPYISERFKYLANNFNRFEVAFNLMQRRYSLNRVEKERFPKEFMEYVSDTLYQNRPVKPFTLVREYLSFMRDYIGYYSESNGMKSFSVSSDEAFQIMIKNGKLKLTEKEIELIKKFEEVNKISMKLYLNKADSAEISETMKPYKEIIEKKNELYNLEVVKKFFQDEWNAISSDLLDGKIIEADIAEMDSLITDPELRDIFEVNKFYWFLDWQRKPLNSYVYQLFKERISNPGLAEPIEKLQRNYSELGQQDIFYAESLKKTEHLKESKDADALFAQLTAPYKGKVIYIDFWGTWCGPCKAQMRYVGDVKAALKDKDVIFMYFANNSPEESWKNVIKEYHLTGENVVHYRLTNEQQAMIERRLSIRAFPTFILMDKEGKIVNMKASRPEQKDMLIEEINKLL